MNRVRVPIGIHIIAILMVCAFFTGCVEVTPPTGEQNASAYGPVSQGSGDMKDLVKGQNQTTPVQTSGQSSQQGTPEPANTSSPETLLPPVEMDLL